MKKENILFLTALITIILVRLKIYLFPVHLYIGNSILYHFWIGVFLIIISLIIPNKFNKTKLYTLGIGLGLFIDELIFMLTGAGSFTQYWSLSSTLGAFILIIILFLSRKNIVKNTIKL